MIAIMAVAAIGLIAFGYWLGWVKKEGGKQVDSMTERLRKIGDRVEELIGQRDAAILQRDTARAERDSLSEDNRRLRNQITAMNLALGLAGHEFNYVPKKVTAAHYAVKAVKR